MNHAKKPQSFKLNQALLCLAVAGAGYLNAEMSTAVLSVSSAPSKLFIVSEKPASRLPDSLLKNSESFDSSLLEYIQGNAKQLGLNASLEGLRLEFKKSSLLADHYYYRKEINGIPVFGERLVVSVNKSSKRIDKIFNGLSDGKPVGARQLKASIKVSTAQALTRSWQFFQPQGKLLSEPKSQLVYFPKGKQLVLAYQNTLELSAPRGSWRQVVDANSAEVLKTQRLDVPHKATADSHAVIGKVRPFPVNKKMLPFAAALEQFKQEQTERLNTQNALMADGSGLVFDPDPRTTLNDETLEQSSPGADFDPAYQSVTLRDITFDGTEYSLVGPWVQIINFDAPNTSPTVTSDGMWRGKRGEPEFYDVMSYFHIDQNQRYMQSLGFTGATGIQEASIEVDADGAGGADNSYYLPGSNRLAFGHGGVPDNEDADVILHEYGHAIHFAINPDWGGGDSGAIGEGFGDYWAGSYSYSTPNGQSFNPNWVYTWDGHNSFWAGRVMNRTSYQYDPSIIYTAHMPIDGQADYSDELWSTPLFQSLVQLINAGQSREEVDQIVLEGQFGLAANIKMPDMAKSIVSAALQLFPNGPHATVFYQNFKSMNILADELSGEPLTVVASGADTIVEPLELVNIKAPLTNESPFAVSNVQGTLTTTATGVTVSAGSSVYPDVASSDTVLNTDDFILALGDEVACGSTLDLTLAVTYDVATNPVSSESDSFDIQLTVGDLVTETSTNNTQVSIPDDNSSGIQSTIDVSGATESVGELFNIDVNIEHSWVGDLIITLRSPQGTEVTLYDPDDLDSSSDVVGNFPRDYTPVESLSAFEGEDPNGTWTLTVSDNAAEDTGTLNSWSINLVSSGTCVKHGLQPQPIVVESAGPNGIVERGEPVAIKIPMLNDSAYAADAIQATLVSRTTGVTVTNADANYTDIDSGATRSNIEDFSFTSDTTLECGSDLEFTVNYQYRLDGNDLLAATASHDFVITLPDTPCDADSASSSSDDSTKELLYALALIILIGVEAGSMNYAAALMLLLLLRRRHRL